MIRIPASLCLATSALVIDGATLAGLGYVRLGVATIALAVLLLVVLVNPPMEVVR